MQKTIEEIAEGMASRKFTRLLSKSVPNPKWVAEKTRWLELLNRIRLGVGEQLAKRAFEERFKL